MGTMRSVAFVLGLWISTLAWSQPAITRADLAVRLLEMEACWEAHRQSPEARLRATRPLTEGLTAFFSGRLDVLARQLTLTCLALRSDAAPTPEQLYAGSLGVRLPRVFEQERLERGEQAVQCQLFAFYATDKPEVALQLRWAVRRASESKPLREGTLNSPEAGATLTLLSQAPEGDYEVVFELKQGDQTLRQWRQPFSIIRQLDMRLEALDRAAETHDDADPTERMTVLNAVEVLRNALKGETPETYYPMLRLLQFAEQLAAGWEQGQSGWRAAPGDYWMATLYRERKVVFRLFVPPQFQPNKPIPLVLALHGAGGNEHLFFDGYGLGIILKEAAKRGWAVVAPRSDASLAHVAGALEAAQQLLPVDHKRIYLMGHSMGGAQSFAAIAQFPDKFRAAVIFAGAGQPTQVPTDLPILMVVGEQELPMLQSNIENAYRRLQGMNLKILEYKRYEACDHIMIVREAMPEAFVFLERAPAR